MNVPASYTSSPTFQFITSQGWNWQQSDAANLRLDSCPYCGATEVGHGPFLIEVHGGDDTQKNRDGLHLCHRCGKSGRLYDLKQHLGMVVSGVTSTKDWSASEKRVDALPDIDACHQALLEDADALDYLMNGRGFSRDIIVQQKIGLVQRRYFREAGEVRAIVYPYLVNGNCIFVHYRTLPTMPLSENKVPKAFSSPSGWDAQLYNGEVLREGIKDLILVEGEANCIAAMDHGVTHIAGVPGANFKRADWIDTLDKLGLEKITICYDKDKAGQRAAQDLAKRIGIDKCRRVDLPDFTVTTDEGKVRKGKDLNEWFVSGGGDAEQFGALIEEAKLFDVDGVASSHDAVQEFLDDLAGRESLEPKYKTKWANFNRMVGFEDGDVIDILAEEKVGKTTFAMNLVEHMVDTYGEDGIIICLEMTRARLARKWVSHKAQIADNIPKSAEEAQELAAAFKRAIPPLQQHTANRPGQLYFCLPTYKTDDDLYTLIRDCIRRYGVKWIVIDNLQRWADTAMRGRRNRVEHLSEISKVTSQIAKEFGVQMVRILQPHRVTGMVTTSNVDGASQIAKDCDCMLTLHRNKIGQLTADQFETAVHVEQEASFDDKMLVTVGLSRYSFGGYVTLMYDGARSTVNEFDVTDVARMHASASANVGYDAQFAAAGIAPPVYEAAGGITL